jgi:hypothetical protein
LFSSPLFSRTGAPGAAALDLDGARLHRLRHLAGELDMQEPVLERGAGHLDEVGELEAALERAARDPAMEIALRSRRSPSACR